MERESKILIAIPSTDYMHVLTVRCLLDLLRREQDEIQILTGSLVYNSRTHLVNYALQNGFSHIMWIDSDMAFPPDTLLRLFKHDLDIVTAICYGRTQDHSPCAYMSVSKGDKTHSGIIKPIEISDTMPELIEVDGCGSAMMLVKTDVYVKIGKRFHEWYEPKWNLGEDLAFTERAKACGYKIWCDTTLNIGHIGTAVYRKDDYKGGCKNES